MLDSSRKNPQLSAMRNRWIEQDFRKALDQWGADYGEELAARLYAARLIGAESDLVLHGGGNVSVKRTIRNIFQDEVEAVHVKASGGDMSRLTPRDMPALRLKPLRRLRSLAELDDNEMVNQVRTQLFDASAPTPSIETLLHAFLPHKYIDHSHADAVLALTNQAGGESMIREVLGDRVAYIPYIRPGFALAKAVADSAEAAPHIQGVVLMFHGLITFANDARVAYDHHVSLCNACEEFIREKASGRTLTIVFLGEDSPANLASRVAPLLRGVLAERTADDDHPFEPSILEWRAGDHVLEFVNSEEAAGLCAKGALTGDHVMHTRPRSLLVPEPAWNDEERLRVQLRKSVLGFRAQYREYLDAHGAGTQDATLSPRVVCLPGAGFFATGLTKSEAIVTADIAEHTLKTKTLAHLIGSYESLTDDHLFDMEFRAIQRAKLASPQETSLARQVVVISGAAGAIGAATAERCADAGAHVVLTDIDEQRLHRVVEFVNERFGEGRSAGVPMDVTDEASVREGFEKIARLYGGVDTLVPNAGIAHVAPIDELELADFRRVMEVNAFGYFLFMREGIRMMKRQGTGGHIVVIASKNVFAPGKDFAAYSASKSAAHQLGKVAAIELAPFGIRVNMINPDAVFGDTAIASGLWDTIAANRARSRNITIEELPDFYRQRNLLKARIHARHVGNAVVFFASGQTPTTGATLPVDGGIIEAFPR